MESSDSLWHALNLLGPCFCLWKGHDSPLSSVLYRVELHGVLFALLVHFYALLG